MALEESPAVATVYRNSMQPIVRLEDGRVAFEANKIVRDLLDFASGRLKTESGRFDMNEIAGREYSQLDREQFAQLIGYSLAGFHELHYVSDATALEASQTARAMFPSLPSHSFGCRYPDGCPVHGGVERE